MTPLYGYEKDAKMLVLEDFKKKFNILKIEYKNVEKQFNELCDILDKTPLNEEYINNIVPHLTIYLTQLEIIEKDIKVISDIIENLRIELSN